MRAAAILLLAVALGACGDSPCDPTSERCSYQRTTSETTIASGEEIDGLCQSWTLDNPTELWVENVAMDNGGAYHHSNWFFVPDDVFPQPDGPWPCAEGGFDELAAALTGGYLFAQSTQVADQHLAGERAVESDRRHRRRRDDRAHRALRRDRLRVGLRPARRTAALVQR